MTESARDILVDAVQTNTLRPDLVPLVQGLPRPIAPWSTNDTVTSYAGLINQAQGHLILWTEATPEEEPDLRRSALEALYLLTEWLDSMTYAMRDFLDEIDAPAEVDGEPAIRLDTNDRQKAIEKLRAGVENDKMPAKVRELLEQDLSGEEFQTAAEEIRTGSEELRDKIAELEGEVAELETEAEGIEEKAQAVEDVGDRVLSAIEALDELDEASGRDEKEEARDRVFEALEAVVEAYDEATAEVD